MLKWNASRRALYLARFAGLTMTLGGLGAPSLAQEAAPPAPAEREVVVITASRIDREGFTAPTPTTVIGEDVLQERAALTISDVLFEVPAIKSATNTGGISQAGGNYVSLRGFGQSRTLVLVDGRRFVPTNAGRVESGDAVDTNVIPAAAVERLDVVTGGASAAWGSDAIGGVINIVLKNSLSGFEGNIQAGMSEEGDAKTTALSLAWGTGFAEDNGQILIAGEYSNRTDMPTNADREWSNSRCAFAPGTFGGVSYSAVQTCGLTLSGYTNGGVLVAANGAPLPATSPLRGKQFLSSTSSSPYAYGQLIGNSVMVGGDGGWISDTATVVAPLERETLYAHTTYDFSDDLSGFFEASYARTLTDFDQFVNSIGSSSGNAPILVQRGNPYIPADIAAILVANPSIASINVGRIAPDLGNVHSDSENKILSFAAGLNGTLWDNLEWNVYATHGTADFDTHLTNNIILSNAFAAFDVVINPATGRPDCRINITPPAPGTGAFGAAAGCMPANPFGPGSLANVKDYITGDLANRVKDELNAAGATINAEPFSIWAGPVSLAAGVEWRDQELSQVTSPYSNFINAPAYGAGGFQQANPKSFSGSVTVTEAFAETVIPLLKDQPFAQSLDLNIAGRHTDYSTVGEADTWKIGFSYRPIEGLLFRAAHSQDIRAASLFDQFGSNTTYGGVLDRAPGANNANVFFAGSAVGNTSLKPESADTTTIGITTTSLLIDGLSVSLDYYKVELTDQIGQPGPQGIMDRCYGAGTAAGFAPDPVFCALIDRPASVIRNPQLNLGSINTSGVDLEVAYRLSLPDSSQLSFRVLGNYVEKFEQNSNGLLVLDLAGALGGGGPAGGVAKWGWNGSVGYQKGPLNLFLQARYIGEMRRDASFPLTFFADPYIGSVTYFNASASYKLRDEGGRKLELFGSINNLLNKDPPFSAGSTGLLASGAGQGGGSTNALFYDTLGRTYSVGLRFNY